jgi:hypothetical protein
MSILGIVACAYIATLKRGRLPGLTGLAALSLVAVLELRRPRYLHLRSPHRQPRDRLSRRALSVLAQGDVADDTLKDESHDGIEECTS